MSLSRSHQISASCVASSIPFKSSSMFPCRFEPRSLAHGTRPIETQKGSRHADAPSRWLPVGVSSTVLNRLTHTFPFPRFADGYVRSEEYTRREHAAFRLQLLQVRIVLQPCHAHLSRTEVGVPEVLSPFLRYDTVTIRFLATCTTFSRGTSRPPQRVLAVLAHGGVNKSSLVSWL